MRRRKAHFLDAQTVDRDDPQAAALLEIMIQAYDDENEALALSGQVGLLKADIERYPKLRFTWWSILEETAKEGQLRRLVDTALRDPTTAGWHAQIREVIDVPAGPLVAETKEPKPKTQAERRGAAMRPGVGDSALLWEPGQTLGVRFLDGSRALRKRVEAAAEQWLEYANLKFEFGDDPDAEIRVSFKLPGSWSYLGTQCLEVAKSQPTINFGWLDDTTTKAEVGRVVIHEFGHLLGLQHEHSNPSSDIEWNRKAIYKSYTGPPNHWTREQIDQTIFSIWPPAYFPVHKVFDRKSIMMFPLPKEFLVKGAEIGWNSKLSALDKQFAAALYPLRGREE
jgi:Astacin (Peptidase family M12A)